MAHQPKGREAGTAQNPDAMKRELPFRATRLLPPSWKPRRKRSEPELLEVTVEGEREIEADRSHECEARAVREREVLVPVSLEDPPGITLESLSDLRDLDSPMPDLPSERHSRWVPELLPEQSVRFVEDVVGGDEDGAIPFQVDCDVAGDFMLPYVAGVLKRVEGARVHEDGIAHREPRFL